MKTSVTFLALILCAFISHAQFSTPNTGVNWNLDSLVTNSSTVVTEEGGIYYLNENLLISSNDTFNIQSDDTLKLFQDVSINVNGAMFSYPENEFVITAADTLQTFSALVFNNSQNSVLKNTTLEFGEGIQILNCIVDIDSCIFRKNNIAIAITNSAKYCHQLPYKCL